MLADKKELRNNSGLRKKTFTKRIYLQPAMISHAEKNNDEDAGELYTFFIKPLYLLNDEKCNEDAVMCGQGWCLHEPFKTKAETEQMLSYNLSRHMRETKIATQYLLYSLLD